MADSIMSKAATMEIPINSNGDTGNLAEDDSLEQDLQQVMVSGPNLNETSIVSGGYGGPAGGIIPTSTIKDIRMKSRGVSMNNSKSPTSHIAKHTDQHPGSSNHNTRNSSEEISRGVAVEKLDSVKKWGINTYKCTKQMFSEKFGRGSRTVDLELEAQIDMLRDTKSKYENILRLATALINHFQSMVQTQQALGDTFTDLSQKSPELQDEFGYNAETQKLLCKNGEALLGAINFFVSSVNTLVNKTMEDTLMTIKQYENARLEFDAYRSDLEELSYGPRDATAMVRIEMAQHEYHVHRDKYERLRSDVTIKLKFLEENKVKVMHKQLLLFHNAISAYFAGNQQQLEQTLIQFNVKLKPPGSDKPSWLEEQ
ncbi:arfaptin-2-like isoform X1 [Thalassophryne amazonica]|uniref:arfaptin-2-like isoform X1 n=1 Tax=Thalassophryne amazonica TaxID=390379 RepID=UPI00147217C5|nr:arfaptin-2-like isoform X1 [Thalassophryne amazonica]XP_034024309.1 arfaptin-2-like isoform X1 [Thalassophryne amazonica]